MLALSLKAKCRFQIVNFSRFAANAHRHSYTHCYLIFKIFALAIYSTICIELPFCLHCYLQVDQIFVLTYTFISAPSVHLCRLSIYKNVSLHLPFIFRVSLAVFIKIIPPTYVVLKILYRMFQKSGSSNIIMYNLTKSTGLNIIDDKINIRKDIHLFK